MICLAHLIHIQQITNKTLDCFNQKLSQASFAVYI